MYDKHGSILRIETVINQPSEFKIRRRGERRGKAVTDWFPLRKGVAGLYRYAEISRAANHRYLDALAVVKDPTPVHRRLCALAKPVRDGGRTFRGFNPASQDDLRLFAAVMRGAHGLQGFRNRDLREQLFPSSTTRGGACARAQRLRHSAQVKYVV
jgi:hypothetical protein